MDKRGFNDTSNTRRKNCNDVGKSLCNLTICISRIFPLLRLGFFILFKSKILDVAFPLSLMTFLSFGVTTPLVMLHVSNKYL